MCYTIALNFEDGITRFVDCRKGEKVLDAAFRNKINLPMDCSDGVCGTCKCRAESGSYDMGEDYIEDALTEDEAAEGLVLTCQMVPSSDCVISVPVTAASCKTGQQVFAATVTRIEPQQDAAVVLKLDAEDAPAFLPGQYVNIAVPGSSGHRSYSFSTAPGERSLGFLIKKIEGGLMSGWLTRARTGDRLELTCVLDAGARTLLTTPGAGKIYRTAGGPGRMTTEIEVGPGAVCEYLPQETILFDGADAWIETRVRLARDATYLGWDFLCLGRPAAGEGFGKGAVRQRVEVIRAGRPIWYERLDLPAGSPHLQARFSLAGQPIVATMVYAGPMLEGTDERIRAEAGEDAPGVFSVSQLEDAVVCRYLGASMTQAKTLFGRAWQVLRAGPMGKRAVAPRIWAT